jgi:hypothetical protein
MSSLLTSKHIFLDESGDPELDYKKNGVTDYFVLTSIIIPSDRLDKFNKDIKNLQTKLFSGGEMKSSNIGSNRKRRIKVIDEISQLDFKHYSQVIDKSQIISDSGLQFRRSFIKYVNRILYENLFDTYSELHIYADQHGTSEFMNSFPEYLNRRLPQRLLFEKSSFQFAESTQYPGIQLSDLIAGTILRCYSGKEPMAILEPLHKNTIIIDEWPPRFPEPIGFDELEQLEKYSYIIRHHALKQAEEFIESNSLDDNFEVKAQVAAVRYLLYHFRSIDPDEYISSKSLLRHLHNLGFPMSERMMRTKVIAKIRDDGVFIASTNKGIKIPYSIHDLRDFVNSVNSRVVPYLHRLEICRDYFKKATEGELDIVNENEFPQLYSYLEK